MRKGREEKTKIEVKEVSEGDARLCEEKSEELGRVNEDEGRIRESERRANGSKVMVGERREWRRRRRARAE